MREWAAYERALRAGEGWLAGEEVLDPAAVRLEEAYLGLRTLEGLPRRSVPGRQASEWVSQGWARVERDRLVLTVEGWLRLDALVAAL